MKKLQRKGTHRGYEYLILSMPMGHRCGYIKIPENHPLYDKDYIDETFYSLEVHGGITFSKHIKDDDIFTDGYWIGFDCNHCFDIPDPDEMSKEFQKFRPQMEKMNKLIDGMFDGLFGVEPWMKQKIEAKIRNNGYVESQCKNLCDQVAELKPKINIKNNLQNENCD